MNSENQRHTRLQKLKGSDFEVADGQPDIRGWKITNASGKRLGEVDELVFDYQSRKVRYIVADLKNNDYSLDDRKVLVPIGIAELHKKDDDVVLPGVTAEHLKSLPQYDEDSFDASHETSVRNVFGGLGAGEPIPAVGDPGYYDHAHYNEHNLLRNRRTDSMVEGNENRESENRDESMPSPAPWLRSKNVDQ